MNIYIYEFPGSYLGGNAVVYAESEIEAYGTLLQEMRSVYPDDKPELKKTILLSRSPEVIYYTDGDY